MIRLTIAKPLSVGTITTKDYASYALDPYSNDPVGTVKKVGGAL